MALVEPRERLFDWRRDKSSGREKPYKPALLLALFDWIERGDFPPDRIFLSEERVGRYRDYLSVVAGENDRGRIGYSSDTSRATDSGASGTAPGTSPIVRAEPPRGPRP